MTEVRRTCWRRQVACRLQALLHPATLEASKHGLDLPRSLHGSSRFLRPVTYHLPTTPPCKGSDGGRDAIRPRGDEEAGGSRQRTRPRALLTPLGGAAKTVIWPPLAKIAGLAAVANVTEFVNAVKVALRGI